MYKKFISLVLSIVIFTNIFLGNINIVSNAIERTSKDSIISSPQIKNEEIKVSNEGEDYSFTLESGKNYEITNNSDNEIWIRNNSGDNLRFDITQYKSDGSTGNSYYSVDGSMWIDSGMTLRITVLGDKDATCYIDKEHEENIIVEEVEKTALYKYELDSNNVYSLKNIGDDTLNIYYAERTQFDVVRYDTNGNIESFDRNVSGNFHIGKGKSEKVKILEDGKHTIWMPYEHKDLLEIEEKEDLEVLYKYELDSNVVYNLKNIGDITLNIHRENKTKFDVVRYDENGAVESFDANVSGNFHIGKGKSEKIKILEDGKHTVWMPYEHKDLLEIEEQNDSQVLYKYEFEKKKTYEIKNLSNISVNLSKIYATEFDFIDYDENGNIEDYGKNAYGSINISPNKSKRVVFGYGYTPSTEVYMPYEYKDLLEIKQQEGLEVLYKYEFEKKKTYAIKNLSDVSVNLSKVYATEFDFINYDESGNIEDYGKNDYGSINISPNKSKRVVFGNGYTPSTEVWIPYEYKDRISISELDEPLLYEFEIEKDKNYEIKNSSNEKINIKNSSNWGRKYDYVKYKSDNSYTYLINVEGDIILENKERILISPRETIECYIPYEKYTSEFKFTELNYQISDIFDLVAKVQIDINKTVSNSQSDITSTKVKDNLSNYNISVYNKTKGNYITRIESRGNYIIFPEGSVDSGDNLNIRLNSKTSDCKDINITVILDNNKNAKVNVDVTQLGYIVIDYKENNTKSLINRVLIYDKNGKNIETISKNPNQQIRSNYLMSGKYTVVILKSSGELWKLDNLNEFEERGFIKDEDYIRYDIEVQDGVVNSIKPQNIPTVNEDRLSYFDKSGTMFTTKIESVSQNSLIEVRLEYKFKSIYSQSNIKDKIMRITLPEEVSIVDNSIVVDNKKSSYSCSNNVLEIPIDNMSGIIKFNLRPMKSGTAIIKAESTFKFNNKKINEILGTITNEINYLTINGPSQTSNKNIDVYGIAPPKSKVSIYDGENLLAKVTSLSSGNWNADIELKKVYNGSYHNIVAKINVGTEEEQISNQLDVRYHNSMPSIKKVIMFYDDHGNKKIDLTKALLEGETPLVIFNPAKPLTFEIQIENQDLIDEVYVSSKKNNEEKKIQAIYDENKSSWIASGYFDPDNINYVPGTLSITYKGKGLIYNSLDMDFESEEFKDSLPESWENTTIDIIEDNKDSTSLEVNLNNQDNDKLQLTTTNRDIPSNINTSNIISLGYRDIGNGQYLKLYNTKDEIKTIIIDFVSGKMTEIVAKGFGKLGNHSMGLIGIVDVLPGLSEYGEKLNKYFELAVKYPEYRDELIALGLMQSAHQVISICLAVGSVAGTVTNPILPIVAGVVVSLSSVLGSLIEDLIEDGVSMEMLLKWLIDPSGYVYEAIDGNRVEGVTTTVYYKDENGQAIKWDAEEYGQRNPLITDEEGKYAWDVPEGLWQVKYEKEGYETTYSEWLPVPPPQTEVNIGMVSLEKPKIELFNIYEDRAEITFNKYIDISTANTNSIKLSDSKGNNIPTTINPVDKQESEDNKMLANKFILKFDTKNTLSLNGDYTVTVKNTVKTYAGVSSDSDIIVKTTYKPLPAEIKVGSNYNVNYNKIINIPISIDNIPNADEFEVTATSSMDDIAKVVTDKVKFDKNGKATITVSGELPGEANITFNIEGMDLKAQTQINVLLPTEDNITNTPPVIKAKDIELKVGDKFNLLEGVTAYDAEDGDITTSLLIEENTVNTSKAGVYKVVYSVTDNDKNTVTKEIKVTVLGVFSTFEVNTAKNTDTTISGKGLSGATVKAYVNGKQIGKTATVSSNGTYKITIPKQKANTKIVVKMSKSGYATTEKTITVLNTFATFTVNSINNKSTSISGKGLKGATVKAYVNGKQIGKTVTVSSNGTYKITIPKQKANTKIVVKMSKSGYATTEKTITVLNTFATFTVNSINNKSTSISGKGLKGATVKAYVNGKQIGKTATVSSNGTYKITIPKQKANTKVVVKMSKSGYATTEKTIKVKK